MTSITSRIKIITCNLRVRSPTVQQNMKVCFPSHSPKYTNLSTIRGIQEIHRAAWRIGNAPGLYTEGTGLESRREHVMSGKFQGCP